MDINEIETLNNRIKNRIITYAIDNHLEELVEFMENPGWVATILKLHEIDRAIKKCVRRQDNLWRSGRPFDFDNPNHNLAARFGCGV